MTMTVDVRCENEECRKWFEPGKLEPKQHSVGVEDWHHHTPTGCEAICPHCGARQEVPIMDY